MAAERHLELWLPFVLLNACLVVVLSLKKNFQEASMNKYEGEYVYETNRTYNIDLGEKREFSLPLVYQTFPFHLHVVKVNEVPDFNPGHLEVVDGLSFHARMEFLN